MIPDAMWNQLLIAVDNVLYIRVYFKINTYLISKTEILKCYTRRRQKLQTKLKN